MKEVMDAAASTPEIIGGGVAGIFGVFLFFKKFMVRSSIETANLSTADAYGEIINSLRQEVKRLGEANSELARTLNAIQLENIELKTEVARMQQVLAKMEKLSEVNSND